MKGLCFFIALCLGACAGTGQITPEYAPMDLAPGTPPCLESEPNGRCTLFEASFIQLIARPDLFDGRRVHVRGFANLQFEANALYLSQEMFTHGSSRDAIWLDVEGMGVTPPFRRGYADVEGTFESTFRGHFGMFSGSIRNITVFKQAVRR